MLVRSHHDPREFFDLVGPFLTARESENTMPLGIARSFVDTATHEGLMFSIEGAAGVVGVAVKSPKRNLVVTRAPPFAVRSLANYLYAYAFPVPGVNGPSEAVGEFCAAWAALAGAQASERMRLRLFELTACAADCPPPPAGAFRYAGLDDSDLVERWLTAFIDEATPDGHDKVRETVARMIGAGNVAIWDDAGPVSMAAVTRRSERGAHVAWVYTPPERRRGGYATACVAELTRRELARGRSFCTLYSDLSNPTSNGIYPRIGYVPLCDALDVTFH